MIVEDNELINNSNRKIILEVLSEKQLDYELVMLFNGLDLLKFVLNHQNNYGLIKLILTDEYMDYMNGSEAINIIRKIELTKKFKPINIISVTCLDNQNLYNNLIKIGADMVISKPISKNDIRRIISQL